MVCQFVLGNGYKFVVRVGCDIDYAILVHTVGFTAIPGINMLDYPDMDIGSVSKLTEKVCLSLGYLCFGIALKGYARTSLRRLIGFALCNCLALFGYDSHTPCVEGFPCHGLCKELCNSTASLKDDSVICLIEIGLLDSSVCVQSLEYIKVFSTASDDPYSFVIVLLEEFTASSVHA